MSKIKSAREILDKWERLKLNPHNSYDNIFILAMQEYASQFIDLAAEEAKIDSVGIPVDSRLKVNKESILKVKQLIK